MNDPTLFGALAGFSLAIIIPLALRLRAIERRLDAAIDENSALRHALYRQMERNALTLRNHYAVYPRHENVRN
jgi:hypothetical protein